MKLEIIGRSCFVIAAFILGICLTGIYYDNHPAILRKYEEKEVCHANYQMAGYWTTNPCLLKNVTGDWVCVNIGEVKTFKELNRVCRHESMHELWARCGESKNVSYCVNELNEGIKDEGL